MLLTTFQSSFIKEKLNIKLNLKFFLIMYFRERMRIMSTMNLSIEDVDRRLWSRILHLISMHKL